ncbi:MAG: NAD(P)H-dependent oxidoreductase [Deltaproteobacteria bacterium]|nr:NAD(P)H-dependent oxidoreductase [Deltaproteobacteria bacterium]
MKRIVIIFHSQTGKTARLAEALAEGAQSIEGVQVRIKRAQEATAEDLLWADGIALATPENFGYMSGMLKDFFDRTFYAVGESLGRKPYVLVISAGNDGTGAQKAVERILLGWRLRPVADVVISRGEPTEESLATCFEVGATLAAGCALGIF